jgi:hypothetical protein
MTSRPIEAKSSILTRKAHSMPLSPQGTEGEKTVFAVREQAASSTPALLKMNPMCATRQNGWPQILKRGQVIALAGGAIAVSSTHNPASQVSFRYARGRYEGFGCAAGLCRGRS